MLRKCNTLLLTTVFLTLAVSSLAVANGEAPDDDPDRGGTEMTAEPGSELILTTESESETSDLLSTAISGIWIVLGLTGLSL